MNSMAPSNPTPHTIAQSLLLDNIKDRVSSSGGNRMTGIRVSMGDRSNSIGRFFHDGVNLLADDSSRERYVPGCQTFSDRHQIWFCTVEMRRSDRIASSSIVCAAYVW